MDRNKKFPFVLVTAFLVGAMILTGCDTLLNVGLKPTPLPKEVQITEKDNGCGSATELNVGDTLDLVLDGNPSTGFTWEVGFYAQPIVKPLGEPEYQPGSNLLGAGGTYTFQFRAIGEGQTKITMIYHRPFAKDSTDIKTCEVTVTVK